MKKAIKWILSAFVGCVISFVLLLINDSIHIVVTSALVAFSVYFIVNNLVKISDMKKLISVVCAIISFFIYVIILNKLMYSDSTLLVILFNFGPYVLLSYAYFNSKETSDE